MGGGDRLDNRESESVSVADIDTLVAESLSPYRRRGRLARCWSAVWPSKFETPKPQPPLEPTPFGQTIFVTEGIGRCQREGGRVEEIRSGDRVFFEPGENHWHGAAPEPTA